jgi:dihydroorotase
MPGLIDLHVHLRDPGLTYKEDVVTGAKAGAKGGFTTILAMPNTKPVIDCADRVNYVHNKAKELAPIHVLQVGAVTKQQKGEELADIEGMIKAGIPAISEDGKSVMNTRIYKEAMQIAADHNIPVFAHCEDQNMVNGGCVNEDEKSKELGLPVRIADIGITEEQFFETMDRIPQMSDIRHYPYAVTKEMLMQAYETIEQLPV